MAQPLSNIADGISMDQLLTVLAQLGIVPSAEQASRLNVLGGGYLIPIVTGITISAPNHPRVNLPVVVISDDEDDTSFPGYPSDETDSDAESISKFNGIDTSPATSNPDFSGEGLAKPGSFLECTTCGAVFDLTLRKANQSSGKNSKTV